MKGRRLAGDERGLSTIEYAIVLVLVVAVAIGLWLVFGQRLLCSMSGANDEFGKVSGDEAGGLAKFCPRGAPPPGGDSWGPGGPPNAAAESRRIAEAITQTGGTGTAADREAVLAELQKLPPRDLQALQDKGVKITVVKNSVVEALPALKGVTPRGWPPGSSWDNVPGLYDPNTNQVIIATRNGAVPATGDGHGSSNLVIHETGHAIDASTGGHNDPAFQAARNQDIGKLDAYETQAGDAGLQESYAESMARHYNNPTAASQNTPALEQYWANRPR
jgi:Flp pilus assembly pilin Flp